MTPEEHQRRGDAADALFREMKRQIAAAGAVTCRQEAVTARPIPKRHWRSYGDDPLPTGREALDEPLRAFPSWFMRITCDRCGKERMFNETHTRRSAPC